MTGGDVTGGSVTGGSVTGGDVTGGDVTGGGAAGGVVTGGGAGGGGTADGVVTSGEDESADPSPPTAWAAVSESVTRPIKPEEAMASGVGTTATGASTPGRPIAGTHGAPVNAASTTSR